MLTLQNTPRVNHGRSFYDIEVGGFVKYLLCHRIRSQLNIGTVTAGGFLVVKQNIFCETLNKEGSKVYTKTWRFSQSKLQVRYSYYVLIFYISALTRVPIKKNQMGQMQKLLPANVTGNFPIWLFLSSCSQGFNRKKVLFSLIFTFVLSGLLLFCKVCFILDLYFSRLFCSGKFNSAKKQILPLILFYF